jgi:hypothetical protein
MFGSNGCSAGFALTVGYYAPPTDADVEKVRQICANKRPETQMHGALFSKGRLEETQLVSEQFTDPREIDLLVTNWTIGYNMGFAHRWESVDQEANVEKVFLEHCEAVVDHLQPPLSPEHLATASQACSDAATGERQKFGPEVRCLLAHKDMNGELSGLATKPGCPHE